MSAWDDFESALRDFLYDELRRRGEAPDQALRAVEARFARLGERRRRPGRRGPAAPPPQPPPPRCLVILGLLPPCTAAEVRAAYRRLALVTHPDVGGSDDEFREIEGAYRQALALVEE